MELDTLTNWLGIELVNYLIMGTIILGLVGLIKKLVLRG